MDTSTRRDELRKEFRALGDQPPDDDEVIDSCLAAADECGISIGDFCIKWASYTMQGETKNGAPESVEDVIGFRKYLGNARQPIETRPDLVQPVVAMDFKPFITTDDFFNLQSYGMDTVPLAAVQATTNAQSSAAAAEPTRAEDYERRWATWNTNQRDRVPESDATWQARTDQGRVRTLFGSFDADQHGLHQHGVSGLYTWSDTGEEKREEHDRYMFDEVEDIADSIRQRIRRCERRLLRRLKAYGSLDENLRTGPEAFYLPGSDPVLAVGRIRVELEGSESETLNRTRMNIKSVLLESDEGNSVKLDLEHVKSGIVLSAGQVVAVQGMNLTGNTISVAEIHEDAGVGPVQASPKPDDEIVPITSGDDGRDPATMRVIFAAGPFTTSDSMTFKVLEDLLQKVEEAKPAALVLIGPFVSESLPAIKETAPEFLPEEIFVQMVLSKVNKCLKSIEAHGVLTECYIVGSTEDAFGDFVFPQPPLNLDTARAMGYACEFDRVHIVPNPSFLSLGDGENPVIAALTSVPVLEDMSAECIVLGPSSDRLSAICSVIVQQGSLYPLFPAAPSLPLDASRLERLEFPPHRLPDLLVLPSKLKLFASKVHGDVVCVNPGSACKYDRSGTFADILVDPNGPPRRRVRAVNLVHI